MNGCLAGAITVLFGCFLYLIRFIVAKFGDREPYIDEFDLEEAKKSSRQTQWGVNSLARDSAHNSDSASRSKAFFAHKDLAESLYGTLCSAKNCYTKRKANPFMAEASLVFFIQTYHIYSEYCAANGIWNYFYPSPRSYSNSLDDRSILDAAKNELESFKKLSDETLHCMEEICNYLISCQTTGRARVQKHIVVSFPVATFHIALKLLVENKIIKEKKIGNIYHLILRKSKKTVLSIYDWRLKVEETVGAFVASWDSSPAYTIDSALLHPHPEDYIPASSWDVSDNMWEKAKLPELTPLALDREKNVALFASSCESVPYFTTLKSCTCMAFRNSHKGEPCKHMVRLAVELHLRCDGYPDRNVLIANRKQWIGNSKHMLQSIQQFAPPLPKDHVLPKGVKDSIRA